MARWGAIEGKCGTVIKWSTYTIPVHYLIARHTRIHSDNERRRLRHERGEHYLKRLASTYCVFSVGSEAARRPT
jgi:hypothetical protein